jgi:CRP/FNR family transcriptional regulator, cyclic AMP receptor protein
VNTAGKEAVVAILGPGDFFGESCLAGQLTCMSTATAIVPTSVLFIEKDEMLRVLRTEHKFSDRFINHMLTRNIRIEQDLIDQLFNSSEKRLARTLLLLAHYGSPSRPQNTLAAISQETLAEMIGTTRSRVNFFMNKFRTKGYIKYSGYNGQITINSSLLDVVLHANYATFVFSMPPCGDLGEKTDLPQWLNDSMVGFKPSPKGNHCES